MFRRKTLTNDLISVTIGAAAYLFGLCAGYRLQAHWRSDKSIQLHRRGDGRDPPVLPPAGSGHKSNHKPEKPKSPGKPSNGTGMMVLPPAGSGHKPNHKPEKPKSPGKPSNGTGMTVLPPAGSGHKPNHKPEKPKTPSKPSNGSNMPAPAPPPVYAPGNPQTSNPVRNRSGGGRSGRGSSDHIASAFLVGVGLGVGLMALASNQDPNGNTNCPPYVPTYPGLDGGNSPLSGGGSLGIDEFNPGNTTLGGSTSLGTSTGSGFPGTTGSESGLSNTTVQGPDEIPQYFPVEPNGTEPNEGAPVSTADSLLVQGEEAFSAREYDQAAQMWKEAIKEAPQSGILWMMLGQALFAQGEHVTAANVTRHAMQMLPEDQWGVVVQNYSKLYYTDSTTNDYVEQLKSLEEARLSHPDAASLRFLLGFHYGYLGYRTEAVRELDKLIELGSNDELSRKMRDQMAR